MKVSVYDADGGLIGIAWHENDFGYVELPAASRECTATHFALNDGKLQQLPYPTRVPVDGELRLRIHPPRHSADEDYFARALRDVFGGGRRSGYEVDRTETDLTMLAKLKRWLEGK